MSPRPDIFHARRGRDGFTLIETLVAFAVMATLLSVLFRGVVTLRAGAFAFDARIQEDVVARAILDDALTNRNLRAGTYSGIRDGRRWTMVAKAMDLSAQIPAARAIPAPPPGPGALRSQTPLPVPSGTGSAPPVPAWAPQRLIVRVETTGRPVEIETIRLVKAE